MLKAIPVDICEYSCFGVCLSHVCLNLIQWDLNETLSARTFHFSEVTGMGVAPEVVMTTL